jgi:hypothetical protein
LYLRRQTASRRFHPERDEVDNFMFRNSVWTWLFYAGLVMGSGWAAGEQPNPARFAIEVVDDQSGRGVPLVELTTTAGVTYVTDSAGLVALDDPALINQRVFFSVKSHGYEFPKDGFGFRGVALDVKPVSSAQIKIKRLNIAERLYRVTGEGIYRDSVLLGRQPPIREPLLNAKVTGSDSVMNVIYQGRLHWFWGDTNWPAYPLGLFHIAGAVSKLPQSSPGHPLGGSAPRADSAAAGLDPAAGVNLEYFTGENGFARATAKMPGEGPTWISGVAVLPDAAGRERMLCGYVKIKPPMTVYRRGLAEWDDDASEFRLLAEFDKDAPLYPDGHPLRYRDGDVDYVYFASPFPVVRTRATAESYRKLATYEAYTCLKEGSTIDKPQIDRDGSGGLRYTWRKNAPPLGPGVEARLIREGLLQAHEARWQLRDAASGKSVLAHAGSVYWNEYRQRFVMIVCEQFGSSFLGETWYAEAETPLGPWHKAVKIVTHDKYSFYNPKQHPYFDQDGGRIIYFEGTYTHTFSGNEHKTPRYDYNQIMYRLDLADQRLTTH